MILFFTPLNFFLNFPVHCFQLWKCCKQRNAWKHSAGSSPLKMGLSKACLPPVSSSHEPERGKMNCLLCCLDLVAWRVTLYCQGRSDTVLWPLDICLPLWHYKRQAGSDFLWPSSWGKCLLLGEPVALPILVSFCYPHPSKIKLKKKNQTTSQLKKAKERGKKKKGTVKW